MANGPGAPEGNQNAKKAKIFTDALRKALAQDDWRRLKAGCEKVADAFEEGEPWAAQFVSDRLDGKPAQSTTLENPDGTGLFTTITRLIVDPK